ncbi:MAG: prepilin-type N-terminal cleavage/methylation domain-containing protein [bacterium]|nr:prepilin-type N-terminal cleavage/methylation domain-containing protein [bacterium]
MRNRGFTLVEVMLSITAIGIIAGASVPIYQTFQVRNDLDIATTEIVQGMRRAHVLSQSVDGDTSWGVDIQSGSITIFKGASYASRDTSYDEVFDLSPNVTPSGLSGVVFTKFTGVPSTTGTATLTSNSNEVRTITINSKGMVNY